MSAFRSAALAKINTYRFNHYARSVTESASLDASAQAKVELILSTGDYSKSTAGVGEIILGQFVNQRMLVAPVDASVPKCIGN